VAEASPPARPDIAKFVVLAIGALLTAAIISIIVWSTSKSSGRADIHGRVAIVEVVSDRLIAVTVEVEKAPLASAECDVSAFDAEGVSVGRLTRIVFGPNTGNQRLTTLSVDVPTPLGRAVSAQVATCHITRTR
jgi:hypothetical protein